MQFNWLVEYLTKWHINFEDYNKNVQQLPSQVQDHLL